MTRGGKREGAGRPAIGKQTTKATIYIKDRELLNSFAQKLDISVNELIHRIIRHDNFESFLDKLK
ncbi:MAG: hypothetical protein PHE78_00810 [Candidatus Gastranaerophilales bacterium]|nr:hypothetical protein [Candidatus Gastranaerophilales bacterium]